MNRHEAIERAVNGVIAKWDLTGFIDTSTKDYSLMIAIKEALAMPEDAEAVLWVNPNELANEYMVGINAVKSAHQDKGKHYTMPLYTHPPKADPEPVIEQVMAEYEREMCPWDNVDYLHRCADRYANVKEPSHLHCLAFALSRKLKSQPQADPERVALLERIDCAIANLAPNSDFLRDIRAYLTKGGA